jgi:endogenous inhibitor of DNA gyrase (YacG/DUF329 family)
MGVKGRRNGVYHYVKFTCAQCGIAVKRDLHSAGRARFCSRTCAGAYGRRNQTRTKQVEVSCVQCGRLFERWAHDTGRRFCGWECRRAWNAARRPLARIRLAAYQAAMAANRRAQEAGIAGRLTRDDVLALWQRQPVCRLCGAGRGLDHVIAMSRGGANVPGNLQTLCQRCNQRKRWTDAKAA